MAKITNAINTPCSSITKSLTLGNGNSFLGTNSLDCKGSAAFGTLAGTIVPANSFITAPFLGIGTAVQSLPASTAEFVMPSNSLECDLVQISYVGSSATNCSSWMHFTARGTQAIPTANQNNDILGEWGARGYNGASFATASQASISMNANQNWTTASNGTSISFQVTANGTTNPVKMLSIVNTSTSISGVAITNTGAGLLIKEGTNARMGVVKLLNGSATILNNTVTANTRIFLTVNDQGSLSLLGFLRVVGRVPGVSFTISTGVTLDSSSVISWLLIEPL